MRLAELVAAHVGQTSLDPVGVKGFLQTPPQYQQWGIIHRLNQTALDQLTATDLFEFYLRQYLSGRYKTLHAVLREVRVFTGNDPVGASGCIGYSLARLRQQLLALEWYELLPRLDLAQQQITALLSPVANPVQPAVAGLIGKVD